MLSDGVGGMLRLICFRSTEIAVESFSLFSGSTLSFPPGANKSLASSIPPHQRDSSAISCATGITCTISQVIKKRSVKQLR
jgi:hypothetical protein